MILEKYLEIIDRPSEEVSIYWKVSHIICLVLGGTLGLAACYSFGLSLQEFSENCMLYPEIAFKPIGNDTDPDRNLLNSSMKLDLVHTQWGEEWICQYVLYVPMLSFILSAVFIMFFMMLPRGGTTFSKTSSFERSWHVVVPSAVVIGIYGILLVTSLFRLMGGIEAFCDECEPVTSKLEAHDKVQTLCFQMFNQIANELYLAMSRRGLDSYVSPAGNLYLTLVFLVMCILSWMCMLVSLILRIVCVADFKIVEVIIESSEPQEQKLLQKEETIDETDSEESDMLTLDV